MNNNRRNNIKIVTFSILILLMIHERDKQLEILEEENANLKRLLIELLRENRHLDKLIIELKSKRNSKIDSIQNR